MKSIKSRALYILLIVATVSMLSACANSVILRPPAQTDMSAREKDMNECFDEAIYMSEKSQDNVDRLLIDGKDTVGFLSKRFPQRTLDGIPVRSASLLRTIPGPGSNYAPRAISDRYVICMMKRGYKWEESPPKW